MQCPNCGQEYQEGMSICPHCGSPLPSTELSSGQPQGMPPLSTPPLPGPSGLAVASLLLGIISVVMLIGSLVVIYSIIIPNAETLLTMDQQALLSYIQNNSVLMGASVFTCLAYLATIVGLILGIVGLTQERNRPTRSGRALCIVGIVLSCLPLLCCVTSFVVQIVSLMR